MNAKTAAFVISAIFILPFVLFSATSGQLSDKYDKARVMRLVKSLEIAIMLIGGAGFLLHDVWLLYAGTFLMGVHSTLFGPVKYAYLPQQLNERELVGGNGMIEMGTFVAILVGTIVGGELADLGATGPAMVAAVCLGLAVLGRIVVAFVPDAPSDQPDLKINWNPFTETWRNLKLAKQNRAVFLSLLGISWLWFFGATFLTSFFNFAKDVLGGDPQVVTLLLATFSIGIGFGSLLCEKLSRGKVEIGLVPFGSIGMTVFAVDLYFASHALQPGPSLVGIASFLTDPTHRVAHWHVMLDLFLLAMFGGLYSVPLYALIQSRSQPSHRARIIAANNILNSLFMIVSSILAIVLFSFGITIPQLFLVVGLLNAVVAIYIYSLVPEFLMRFLAWMLVSTFYRIRTTGVEHIPADGPALLVCNHVSFVDAVVIIGALFAIPLAVISLMGIALLVLGLPDDAKGYRSAFRYAAPTLLAMAAFVVGGFLCGDARTVAWIVGVIIMKPTIRSGRQDWILRPLHFAERHALIVIVALGEVIVAIGYSVIKPLDQVGDLPELTGLMLVAAGVFAGLLWWAYFDRLQPAFEHSTEESSPAQRWKFARDIYTYAHAPIVAGVVLSAVALEEVVVYPSDPLPAAYRAMGAVGIAFYFGGMAYGEYRAFGTVTRERVIAVAFIVALMVAGYELSGVALLVAIDVILLATLILEQRRIGT